MSNQFVVTDKDGNRVEPGDTIKSPGGDGEEYVLKYASRADEPGRSGKVVVTSASANEPYEREFYADVVFGLTVTRKDSETAE